MRNVWIVAFCWLVLVACGDKEEDRCAFVPETSSVKIDLNFESLEDSLPGVKK
ncbi:MAG: hypothetical protein WDN75_01580 [Bacteroidota bacterium]